jgi:hypothetical protein
MGVGSRFAVAFLAGSTAAIGMATEVRAQWTVTRLHPIDATESQAFAVRGGFQGGQTRIGNIPRASLWNGSADSRIDLHPSGATSSFVFAIDGQQQAGYIFAAGQNWQAGIWSGSAASWVNIHPPMAILSFLNAAKNGQQVGTAQIGSEFHACIWHGTSASWVDMHPTGASSSSMSGTDGFEQVGNVTIGGRSCASLWRGGPNSWVDLSPPGSIGSTALGIGGGQQVGVVLFEGMAHAGLWRGSAASWVDLHPPAGAYSTAVATDGNNQIGYFDFGPNVEIRHACVWNGTVESWVDLHTFLPQEFTNSQPTAIWTDGLSVYVVGQAVDMTAGRGEAVMWTKACTTPAITSQPDLRTPCLTSSTSFSVVAQPIDNRPMTFRWQWRLEGDSDWVAVVNGANAVGGFTEFEATGATTTRVSLRPPVGPGGQRAWPNLRYETRAIVSDACGPTYSAIAQLLVCPADFNCDSFLDFFDYDEFVTAFETGGGLDADFNGDGFVDFFDYDDFVLAFETGC